jgi:hypothetical protein
MAIYEWQDVRYLGKITYGEDDLPVSIEYKYDKIRAKTCLAENIYMVL